MGLLTTLFGRKGRSGDSLLSRKMVGLTVKDYLDIRDLATGVEIFGPTGGGKTTGPLQAIAKAGMREPDIGQLVVLAKRSDLDIWLRWYDEVKCQKPVKIIGPGY